MKLTSINTIPLSYIQSVVKIDASSPSGLTWLIRQDVSWHSRGWNTRFANKTAGNKNTDVRDGYQCWRIGITYNNKTIRLKSSRVILLLHKGYLTKGKIVDHIDANPLNNKIENLREGTTVQNSHNTKLKKNNTSGYKGVSYNKKNNTWRARIAINLKQLSFGSYKNKEDAIKAVIKARKKLHGKFGRDK